MSSPIFIIAFFGGTSLLMSIVFLRYSFNLVLNTYLILFCFAMFFNEALYLHLNPNNRLDPDMVLLVCSILFLYVIFMRFGSGLIVGLAGDQADPTVTFCERVPDRVLLAVMILYLIIKAYLVHKVGMYLAFNPGQARIANKLGHMGGFDQAIGELIDAPALGALAIAAVKVGIQPRRLVRMALLVGPILPLYLIGNLDAAARRTLICLTLMMLMTFFYVRDFRVSIKSVVWILVASYALYFGSGYYQLVRFNFAQLYVAQHGHFRGLTISDVAKRIFEPQQPVGNSLVTTMNEALTRNVGQRSPYFELFLKVTEYELRHPNAAFGGALLSDDIKGAIPNALVGHKEVADVKSLIAGRFGEPISDLALTPFSEAVADWGLAGIGLVPFLFLFTYLLYRWIMVHVSPSSWLVGPAIISVMLLLTRDFEAGQAIFLNVRPVIILWIIGLPMWALKQLLYPPWSPSSTGTFGDTPPPEPRPENRSAGVTS